MDLGQFLVAAVLFAPLGFYYWLVQAGLRTRTKVFGAALGLVGCATSPCAQQVLGGGGCGVGVLGAAALGGSVAGNEAAAGTRPNQTVVSETSSAGESHGRQFLRMDSDATDKPLSISKNRLDRLCSFVT